jgi:hypothetical protein
MSGYLSADLRHRCATDGCYQDLVMPNWEWMRGAFPRGIMPMDVDGLVEVGGRFLVIDHKRPLADFTRGARVALRRLGNLPEVTVLGLRPAAVDSYEVAMLAGADTGPPVWWPTSREQLRHWLHLWAAAGQAAGR